MFSTGYLLLAFIIGIIVNKLWNAILYTGYSVYILKGLQDESVKLMGSLHQSIVEIEELRAMNHRSRGMSDREVEFHAQVSKKYADTLKNNIVNAYISRWPARYREMLQFYNWDSAMDYLEKLIKKERLQKFNK